MEKLKVRDLCLPCSLALAVKESDGLEAAIRRFASQPETHAIFVVDNKGKLKGLVKIRHLLNWIRLKLGVSRERRNINVAEAFEVAKLSQSSQIGDITSPAVTVKPEDSLAHALNLMANEEVVELAVVNDDGELVGEIKLTQVLSQLLDTGSSAQGK